MTDGTVESVQEQAVRSSTTDSGPVRPRRSSGSRRVTRRVIKPLKFLYPFIVVCGIWEIIARVGLVSNLVLAPFSDVMVSLYHGLITGGYMWNDVGATFVRAGTGFAIAVVVGIIGGLAMAESRRIRDFLDPLISAAFPLPKLALFPLLMVWIGTGNESKIVLVAFGSVFPVLINTYSGSQSINRYIIWNARSKGCNKLQMVFRVILPASMPSILPAIRMASAVAFLLTVSAEIVSSTSGLGYLIMSSEQAFEPAETLAAIVLTGVLGLLVDRAVYGSERVLLRWQERS